MSKTLAKCVRSFFRLAPSVNLFKVAGLPRSVAHVKDFIAEIPNGIATEGGANLSSDGRLIAELSELFSVESPEKHRLFEFKWKRLFPKIPHFKGNVVSLTADCHNNNSHWIYDTIPRILLLRKHSQIPDKIYLSHKLPFQKRTLKLLGFQEEQIIDCNKIPYISADNLIVSSFPHTFPPSEWVCSGLRDTFFPVMASKNPLSSKRIFISRSDATYRYVPNEDDIFEDLLRDRGFVKVTLSDKSFEEQVRIFYDAECIVSPHGSGLANLVFSRPGTKVLEVFHPEFVCTCFWKTAVMCKLDYAFQIGIPPSVPQTLTPPYQDIIFDPEMLQRSLELLEIDTMKKKIEEKDVKASDYFCADLPLYSKTSVA